MDFTALWGHTWMHFPQSMHRSLRMAALPLRTRMASVGQFLMQVVQPRQRLYSNMTECFIMVPVSPQCAGPGRERLPPGVRRC